MAQSPDGMSIMPNPYALQQQTQGSLAMTSSSRQPIEALPAHDSIYEAEGEQSSIQRSQEFQRGVANVVMTQSSVEKGSIVGGGDAGAASQENLVDPDALAGG